MNFKNLINFLKDLKINNNRDWFQQNKTIYDQLRKDFINFVDILISELRKIDPDVGLVNPKDCIFRIYRDVRFSKDKSPYKTNFGAYVVKEGRKSRYAGYYLHIEPENSFAGGGIYMPPNPILKLVRTDIYENIDEFKLIINNKYFKKHFNEIYGSKLKKVPQGFPTDFPDADLLKFKDYIVMKAIGEGELLKDDLLEEVIKLFKVMVPFNKFINNAIIGN